jgi:hypothetical protein
MTLRAACTSGCGPAGLPKCSRMNAARTHHGRVVPRRVQRYPLQRVDAADPHIELVRSELLDRLGVTVGHLPLLGQPNCPLRRLSCPLREEGVPRREDQRTRSKQARSECEQPSTCCVPGLLQAEDSQWSGDVPNIVPGERIGAVPDQHVDEDRGHRAGNGEREHPFLDCLPSLCLRCHRQNGTAATSKDDTASAILSAGLPFTDGQRRPESVEIMLCHTVAPG